MCFFADPPTQQQRLATNALGQLNVPIGEVLRMLLEFFWNTSSVMVKQMQMSWCCKKCVSDASQVTGPQSIILHLKRARQCI